MIILGKCPPARRPDPARCAPEAAVRVRSRPGLDRSGALGAGRSLSVMSRKRSQALPAAT